jgi:hypothetical protein
MAVTVLGFMRVEPPDESRLIVPVGTEQRDLLTCDIVGKNCLSLLLLMVACALAHYRGAAQPSPQDFRRAASMLAAAWPQYGPVVDVDTMVA